MEKAEVSTILILMADVIHILSWKCCASFLEFARTFMPSFFIVTSDELGFPSAVLHELEGNGFLGGVYLCDFSTTYHSEQLEEALKQCSL
jgi:hypothetical protein